MSAFQNLPWCVLIALIPNRWLILFQRILVVAWFTDFSRARSYFTPQNLKKKGKKSSNYILHIVMNLFIAILIKQLTFNIPNFIRDKKIGFYYFFILLECMVVFIGRDFVSRYFKWFLNESFSYIHTSKLNMWFLGTIE